MPEGKLTSPRSPSPLSPPCFCTRVYLSLTLPLTLPDPRSWSVVKQYQLSSFKLFSPLVLQKSVPYP